ncbi:MAG: hypothetical protein M1819_004253 [Sarea resinae]|nr:MAG: hypothetical protein M1819_004253 [Sarea resinae]
MSLKKHAAPVIEEPGTIEVRSEKSQPMVQEPEGDDANSIGEDSNTQAGIRRIEANLLDGMLDFLGWTDDILVVVVVQSVVNAVIKPPMAKLSDVFGRLEAFTFSVFLYVIGYIQMAASKNVQTYASAQVFYSAGSTGLQILQQIFIADTSDLVNRALFSSLPDVPFLATVWIGPPIAQSLLGETTWRWGYGIWTIVLPVAFMPLALALFLNARKAARLNLLPPQPWKGRSFVSIVKSLWFELDIMGLLLLSAAIALILVPLTLAASAHSKWHNGSIIAMLVVGCVCLVIFPFWEMSKVLAPRPLLSLRLLKERTILAGCAIAFFYYAVFYTSIQPYFYSYLQVVQGDSITAAGHITQTFSFTSTVTSVLTGLCIKYVKHYKYFVTFGACIYLMGIGLMIKYRNEASSTAQIVGTQIAVGIGGGMLNVPAQLGVQASASHQEVAAATAIFLATLEIGGAVGSAISGAVWSANIQKKLKEYLPANAKGDAASIYSSLVIAKSYAKGSAERAAIDRSYQETMHTLLIISVCLCAPLIPLSLIMKNYKLGEVSGDGLPLLHGTCRLIGDMQMNQHVKGKVIGHSHDSGSDSDDTVGEREAKEEEGHEQPWWKKVWSVRSFKTKRPSNQEF